jgi:hypothetical protein
MNINSMWKYCVLLPVREVFVANKALWKYCSLVSLFDRRSTVFYRSLCLNISIQTCLHGRDSATVIVFGRGRNLWSPYSYMKFTAWSFPANDLKLYFKIDFMLHFFLRIHFSFSFMFFIIHGDFLFQKQKLEWVNHYAACFQNKMPNSWVQGYILL